jgi:hypothetical protein
MAGHVVFAADDGHIIFAAEGRDVHDEALDENLLQAVVGLQHDTPFPFPVWGLVSLGVVAIADQASQAVAPFFIRLKFIRPKFMVPKFIRPKFIRPTFIRLKLESDCQVRLGHRRLAAF